MSNINITINLNVDERVTGLLASLISRLGTATAVADKQPEQTPTPHEQPKQPVVVAPAPTPHEQPKQPVVVAPAPTAPAQVAPAETTAGAPAKAPADMPDFITPSPEIAISDQALTEHTRSCVKHLSDAGISPLGIKTSVYKQFGVNQALEVRPEQRAAFIAALTDYVSTKLQEASHA